MESFCRFFFLNMLGSCLLERSNIWKPKLLFTFFSQEDKDIALILFKMTLQMPLWVLCIKNSVISQTVIWGTTNELGCHNFFSSPGVQLVPWSERSNNFQCSKLLLPLWQPGCNYGTWWYSKILLVSIFKNENYIAHDFNIVAVARYHLIIVLRYGFFPLYSLGS